MFLQSVFQSQSAVIRDTGRQRLFRGFGMGLGIVLVGCWVTPWIPAVIAANPTVHQWGVFEAVFISEQDYPEPLWDVRLEVTFTGPQGQKWVREAFWDGGRTWRVRFSPPAVGAWSWHTHARPAQDKGLHEQKGQFQAVAYQGKNPLYRHGALRVAATGTHLEHVDGTPFFWLSDTAWNGVLRARPEDWQRYLSVRRQQGFTAVQFVSTQWRGANKTLTEHVFTRNRRLGMELETMRKLDQKVAMVNEEGLIAAPVLLWALTANDPGIVLPEAEAQRLCEYLIARWGAYQVVWILGGDSTYRDTERWQRLGRALFPHQSRDRLVTLHPSTQNWVWDRFGAEPWVDFLGYQSGHGDNADHLRWLIEGPPAKQWNRKPIKPVINLEPNYEDHPSYHSRQLFQPYHVRRAAYWSLLVAPPAGVSYGHHNIWPWLEQRGPVEGHKRLGEASPWSTSLQTSGAEAMGILKAFFLSGPWTQLRPAPNVLAEQPGAKAPAHFIAAAATPTKKWMVIYTPVGGTLRLRRAALPETFQAYWFDPRTGKKQPAQLEPQDQDAIGKTPDSQDWILDIRSD